MQYARLKMIGIIVLFVGLGSAGAVYWLGTRPANVSDDPSMAGYSKMETQQMQTMYGTMGTMTDDLVDALKRPGVRAILIAGISIVIAAGCFYFARPGNNNGETG